MTVNEVIFDDLWDGKKISVFLFIQKNASGLWMKKKTLLWI